MKRAIDLSLKHTYLAHDVQKVEGTPYASYLEINEVRPHVALICAAHSASSSAARSLRCPPSHVAAGAQGPAGAPREQVDAARAVNTYIFSMAASSSCLYPLQAFPAVHQHECLLSLLGSVLHLACRWHNAGGIAQQRIHVAAAVPMHKTVCSVSLQHVLQKRGKANLPEERVADADAAVTVEI